MLAQPLGITTAHSSPKGETRCNKVNKNRKLQMGGLLQWILLISPGDALQIKGAVAKCVLHRQEKCL